MSQEKEQCCTPTTEEKALLAAGDYTPEELWGGSHPTCPKCIESPMPPAGGEVECAICADLGDQCVTCEDAEFAEWADRHFASADYRQTSAGVFVQDWMRHSFAAWQARGKDVIRLQAENAALQQRLNVADQQNDELTSNSFQQRVKPWMMECFGAEISRDQQERNHRFIEEALELIQSCGASASEAHQLVDYVYGRPVGDKVQEIGGVMVTLAALCLAHGLNMHIAGETELQRIWTKVDQIRTKQAAKPKHSPLPQ